METFSTDIYEIWSKSQNLVIATHSNPDGDAVGSALALALAAATIGAKPIILIENYSEKFNFIKGKEYIYNGDYSDIDPDVFIAVDCASKDRLGESIAVFNKANITFNIDHHISNDNFAQNNIVLNTASSSCEVVFEIIKNFCVLDKSIAEALYTGIVTDTFAFKHACTSKNTMEIGGKLIEFGIPYSDIQDKVLYEHSITEVKIFKKALDNLKIDNNIAYTTIISSDMNECGAASKDLDGIVEYILNIKNIKASIFVYQKDENLCKISLRSKKIDVNKIANHFGGGGHIFAAGADFRGNVDDALNSVLTEVKKELKKMSDLFGIINIYKEKGFTSHDVVNIVRKTLNNAKTGHTGTLDPQAEGVLPICIGKATKIADYIASDIKEYKAEILLGISTSTQDITGDIINKSDVIVDYELIEKTIMSFVGEYWQTPPMYSAVKLNGKKLYELAREGKEVKRKKRLINIFDITLNEVISKERVVFTVLCSKGTYIRTLCNDIGEKLGCGACMASLLRTRSGQFFLKDSIKIDDFKKIVIDGKINQILNPIEKVLHNYSKVIVFDTANKYLYNGNKISINFVDRKNLSENEKILVYDSNENIVGIYQFFGNYIKPLTMLI